jgi:hypothetical protein
MKTTRQAKRWLPAILGYRIEIHGGREWAVQLLAPVTAADLRAGGSGDFKQRSAGAVLR